MYRVGLIINENEASHSKYADTEATLTSALDECNKGGHTGNTYHFVVYDKFTISRLFDHGDADIATLNSLIIATNALGFGEKLHNVLCSNKIRIEQFIDGHKGLFISSQKKLSNGVLATEELQSVSFLPEPYDYYLFDRPERYSSEGHISAVTPSVLLDYPYHIDDALIEKHCTQNHFMVHKYRSLIIPQHASMYEAALWDNTSTRVSQKALDYYERERQLLVYSRGSKRIVASTMALDWADHAELLSNILTYITELGPRLFFVKKRTDGATSEILDPYIIRANIANIPYRVISETELPVCSASPRHAFVFSPAWDAAEVEKLYASLLHSQRDHFTIYHICTSGVASDRNHKLSKFRNFSSIDVMKDAVIEALLSSYQPTSWGRSVWTYSYVVSLLEFYDVRNVSVARRVYRELELHFTKIDAVSGRRLFSGDYDGVFNATCKMLEVLNIFAAMYGDSIGHADNRDCRSVIAAAERWMLNRVDAGAVFDQDICYCFLYLTRFRRFTSLNSTSKAKLLQLFEQLLARIAEEIMSGRIVGRSSVDLCRVHQTLCTLTVENAIGSHKAIPYLSQIESTLRTRQDIHGNWKHISETSEITLMLLQAYPSRSNVQHDMNIVNTLIGNAVLALHSQHNAKTSMWADDIAVTAKAMNAIGLYDRVFNLSVNDFFSDLSLSNDPHASESEDLTKERIAYFYRVIDSLEDEKDAVFRQLKESEDKSDRMRRDLQRARYGLASALAILVGTVALLGLLVGIFYVDQKDILLKELGDWRTVLEGAVAGVIAAVILSELFRWLSRRLRG